MDNTEVKNETFIKDHIVIHQGNRLEDLALHLGDLVTERKQRNFHLRPDVVLVNNYEMAQWLSIQIAQAHGICANMDFRLFGSFAWELASSIMPGQDNGDAGPITRKRLKWIVFQCLRDILEKTESRTTFKELRTYISGRGETGIYQLSIQLTDLFDRYLNYRHQMLRSWEQGEGQPGHGWQPDFWKILSSRTRDRLKVTSLERLMAQLQSCPQGLDLPDSIYIFGISYLCFIRHRKGIRHMRFCGAV